MSAFVNVNGREPVLNPGPQSRRPNKSSTILLNPFIVNRNIEKDHFCRFGLLVKMQCRSTLPRISSNISAQHYRILSRVGLLERCLDGESDFIHCLLISFPLLKLHSKMSDPSLIKMCFLSLLMHFFDFLMRIRKDLLEF